MLVRESVALEGAPHRRSATGLPGPDVSGKGPAATLERSVNRGNQRTDRPPFDLVHPSSTNEPSSLRYRWCRTARAGRKSSSCRGTDCSGSRPRPGVDGRPGPFVQRRDEVDYPSSVSASCRGRRRRRRDPMAPAWPFVGVTVLRNQTKTATTPEFRLSGMPGVCRGRSSSEGISSLAVRGSMRWASDTARNLAPVTKESAGRGSNLRRRFDGTVCRRSTKRGRCGAGAEHEHDAAGAHGDRLIPPVTFDGVDRVS